MATLTSNEDMQARVAELENELRAARAEIAVLKASPTVHRRASKSRMRNIGSGVLIALTSILCVVTLLAVWLSTTLLDTNRYVTTLAPLASNSAVQSTVSQRITDQLFAQVDVQAQVKAALPPNAQALAAPLTSQMRTFVQGEVQKAMDTQAFQTAWNGANRITQTQISSLLLGSSPNGVLQNNNGTVSVDLHALVTQVISQMQAAGVSLFDNVPVDKVQGTIELGQSDELAQASTAAEALHTARWVAPILLLIVVGAALFLATSRRKAAAWLGAAFAFGMLVVAAIVAVGRNVATDQAAKVNLPSNTATEVYDTLTRFLVRSEQVIFVLAVVVLLAAVFTGQGKAALALKRAIDSAATKCAHAIENQGWHGGSVSPWLRAHIAASRTVILVVAAATLLLWSHPTVAVLAWIIVVTLLALFIVEVMRVVSPEKQAEQPELDLRTS